MLRLNSYYRAIALPHSLKTLLASLAVLVFALLFMGIFALTLQGLQGAIIVMLSHGASTGAMFLLLGMLYERRHTREIADFGGLGSVMPIFATIFVLAALASIGLPGTSGFVGEFLALVGTFQTYPVIALLATLVVILAAYYMLPMVQRMLFNPLANPANRGLPDLNAREILVQAPLVVLILWIGLYPRPVLDRMEPAANLVIQLSQQSRLADPPRPASPPRRPTDRART
jgi:NADH-quinone oxidoreductase subunit M